MMETIKLIISNPHSLNMANLIRHIPDWLSSLKSGRSSLLDQQPWLTFSAIQFLKDILRKDMRVFEYGSGGSTLFFARHVKEIISIEHNPDWYYIVKEEIRKNGATNCEIYLFEPVQETSLKGEISDPEAYVSEDKDYRGKSFRNYASSIDRYSDESFDVVLIDGRSRPSCFKHAVRKVKRDGYLILDNAERDYYFFIHSSLNNGNWKKYDFCGPIPYFCHFSQTCVWQKVGQE